MRMRSLIWIFMIVMMVGGCTAPSAYLEPTRSPEAIMQILSATPDVSQVTPSVTMPPTATMAPSFTPVPATPTDTVTPTPQTPVVQKCVEMLPALPEDQTYTGKLILQGARIFIGKLSDPDAKSFYEISSYDLTTRHTQFLTPPYQLQNIVISPDQTKYAVQESNSSQIQVFSAQGQLLATVALEKNTWLLSSWVDNQQLAISIVTPHLSPNGRGYWIEFPTDVVIANPFTHEQKRFTSNYPHTFNPDTMWWNMDTTTIYDPTLTRVVYPGSLGYILWDVVNQKQLAWILPRNIGSAPKWSPDGSKFAVPGMFEDTNKIQEDFQSVSRDGEVQRMTYLDPPESEKYRIAIPQSAYAWSPDGRYFAFWIEEIGKGTASLATLDTLTGSVTDYCVSTHYTDDSALQMEFTPVWSPDGKALATIANMQVQEDKKTFDTVLIDLEHGVATKIGENLTPVGWLDTGKK